ncbi:MAG: hypothetical protein GKR96_10535 [Gammaproteobacteria bacterium]|nr:hypothetical protein [Gammaproteobacteria bacterium]
MINTMRNDLVSIVYAPGFPSEHIASKELCQRIATQLRIPIVGSVGMVTTPYAIEIKMGNLFLHCLGQSLFKPISLNFDSSRRFIANDPLIRAIGKNARDVIDATAGWCGDALNLVRHGFNVTAIEQNDVVMSMLMHALGKVESQSVKNQLKLVHQNSVDYLDTLESKVCVVYLDPMYPHKIKQSKSKKNMQVLQQLVNEPSNEETLLSLAMDCATQRVVVKRPHYARPLELKGTTKRRGGHKVGNIRTKLVRFDIYKPFES